ncbi:hypothetical protein RHSIM_Rhsim10G0082400 [Rhododendron simsii]|uniref:Uncharacterized protein n=1 Tax=Rhododendron simsii TaxID=118357 RepID=A0A834LCX6_RHOSS|nr:hypothetical protein RHSIM_Rhsim10G0082400 [Rhododendron simsii]
MIAVERTSRVAPNGCSKRRRVSTNQTVINSDVYMNLEVSSGSLSIITVGFVLQEKIVSSNVHGPKIPEYAVMMGVIYSMLKRDYIMQEKIISSLNLKLSSGELESYNLMWSLRPFIDDEIMHQAWRLVA